jgi:hypothetical protein
VEPEETLVAVLDKRVRGNGYERNNRGTVRQLPAGKDMSIEAEESTLLRAVTRQRLVKT